MKTVAPQVVLSRAWELKNVYEQQLKAARLEEKRHTLDVNKAGEEAAQAARDLGVSVLPVLTQQALDRAARISGYMPLVHERVLERIAYERAEMTKRLEAIERDGRYQNAELLVHPTTGSMTLRERELHSHIEACEAFLNKAEHPRLQTLIESGYGTSAYRGAWWRLSTHRDGRAAKEIEARFSGKPISEILAEVVRVRAAVEQLRAEHARVSSEVANVKALVEERANLASGLQNLESRWLSWLRQRTVEHMLSTDAARMTQWLSQDRPLQLMFLRASGARAKIEYLNGLFDHHVKSAVRRCEEKLTKLDALIARQSRKPTPMPLEKFNKVLSNPTRKFEADWARYKGAKEKISQFKNYHIAGAALAGGAVTYLWWDQMTAGMRGDYMPAVREFYAQNPGYSYARTSKQSEEAWSPAEAGDNVGTAEAHDRS